MSVAAKLPAKLRKAAILISTLDTASADKLLDQMPAEQAGLIRRAIMELEEIQASEQDTVILEFLSSREPQLSARDQGVELDPSLLQRLKARPVEAHRTESIDSAAGPFGFLHEAEANSLGRLLEREHPQITAVVLSHLPPEKAASILLLFAPDLQAAVLRRVAELDSADPEVLRDLEAELHSLFADKLPSGSVRSTGLNAVQAILQATEGHDRKGILENLQQRDGELATRLHRGLPGAPSPTVEKPSPPLPRGRLEPEHPAWRTLDATAADRPQVLEEKHPAPAARAAFTDVMQLSSTDLAKLFHRCDPQVTLLAITGAEEAFVERLFAQLPPRDAKLLRRRMQQLGPIMLRDVERAQERLADVAARLAEEGAIQMTARGFAAAA